MDIMELANKYEAEFKNDMKTLNVLPPTTYMRVTDLIPQIIGFIQTLLDRELAYTTDTGKLPELYLIHLTMRLIRLSVFSTEVLQGCTPLLYIKSLSTMVSMVPLYQDFLC